MQIFLTRLEEALKAHLKETYLPPHRAKSATWNKHDLEFFGRGADSLSTAFTESRADLPKNYLNKKEFRTAYLLYFTLINAAKVWHCLNQAAAFLPRKGPVRILDIGAGPGTTAFAASHFFGSRPIEIFAVEQNRSISRDAAQIFQRFRASENHHLTLKNIPFTERTQIREKQFHLAVASNVLNELQMHQHFPLVKNILRHAELFLSIEPATQKSTRQMMRLRDRVVFEKSAFLLAPCPHQKNCPMLSHNSRDWCHFYIDWKCPEILRQLERFTRNKHDYVKMCYFIYGRTSPAFPEKNSRTVSSPIKSRGKKEYVLCGADGKLRKIERLEKDRTETNAGFDKLKRGDILEYDGPDRLGPRSQPKIKVFF